MSDDIKGAAEKSLDRIKENRAQIIEEFIEFWLAVHIPKEYLTLQLLENVVLVEQDNGTEKRYWMEFMD
jgi:hypothetical protein